MWFDAICYTIVSFFMVGSVVMFGVVLYAVFNELLKAKSQ